jgi:type IV pilus assembly protein PilV
MKRRGGQQGSVLLEALISILIFSFGILAIVGLQAYSVKNTSEAKYRVDASLLADQIIGQMWSDARTNANLTSNYSSAGGGTAYAAWKTIVQNTLPGAAANPPTVVVNADNSVAVTIFWQMPGADSSVHQYTVTTQIN